MSEKMDRRKKYTRRVLKESLIHLLNEKPIADITVKEICARRTSTAPRSTPTIPTSTICWVGLKRKLQPI